jgi:hypothetical protein
MERTPGTLVPRGDVEPWLTEELPRAGRCRRRLAESAASRTEFAPAGMAASKINGSTTIER